MRIIFHMDMDAFYAAVEQRDNPELQGLPVIIGGPSKRGVVSTASYEARPFGVHSAQPMAQALRRCPEAVVVKPRMSVYVEVSRQIMEVLHTFIPVIEPLSLDEAFMDMTGTENLFGPPVEAAMAIKDAIRAKTELSCSIGIGSNKFLAKLASDLDKPDGITLVPFGNEREFIAGLPIRKLWGVGPKSAERLENLDLMTIGDIAEADISWLRERLGKSYADHIHALANAQDARSVNPSRGRKSVGSETTLFDDIQGVEAVKKVFREQCESVARSLRKKNLRASGVRLKVRYSDTFKLSTRQGPLPEPSSDSMALYEAGCALMDTIDLESPIRLVGAAAFDLNDGDEPAQIDMFTTQDRRKTETLEKTLDAIEEKFGRKVLRASSVRKKD